MIQRNCKNCGAPIQHSYNHKCEYCGTLFDFNEPKEETIEFNSRDMIDVHFIGCEIGYETNSLILKFQGTLLEKPKIYEHNEDYMYVAKVMDYMPKRSFFYIEIPKQDLYHCGWDYLGYVIREHINYRESDKVYKEMIDNFDIRHIC